MFWFVVFLAVTVGVVAGGYWIYIEREIKRNSHLAIKPPAASSPLAHPQSPGPVRFRAPPPGDPRYPLDLGPIPLQVSVHVGSARAAREAGDFDAARMYYQKAAYGFKALTPEQNNDLKQEIAGFAAGDPRYQAGVSLVRAAVGANPGVLQSELGKMTGENRESLNYVLYYADQLGDIVRVKSGRSYRLHLPGAPVPTEPEKPRRSRAERPPKAD